MQKQKWLGIACKCTAVAVCSLFGGYNCACFAANSMTTDSVNRRQSPITMHQRLNVTHLQGRRPIVGNMLTDTENPRLIRDIITYYVDLNGDGINEINTHRIVDKYDQGGYVYYVTQGDNTVTNPTPTPTRWYITM